MFDGAMFDGAAPQPTTGPTSDDPTSDGRILDADGEGGLAVALVRLARRPGGILFLARSDGRADRLARIATDLAPDLPTILLSIDETAPGDRAAPSRAVLGRRAAGLATLARRDGGGKGVLALASADLALQWLPPPDAWQGATLHIARGMPFDEAGWRRWFARAGYVVDDRVDEPGEVAIRGAVVEVFPGDGMLPVRCTLEDGRVGEMRCYDPATQRSTEAVLDAVTLHPVSEILTDPPLLDRLAARLGELGCGVPAELRADLEEGRRPYPFDLQLPNAFDRCALLTDYLPDATLVLDAGARDRIEARAEQIADARRDPAIRRADTGPLPVPGPDRRMIGMETLDAALANRTLVTVGAIPPDGAPERFATERALVRHAAALVTAGEPVIVAAHGTDQARRLAEQAARALGGPVPVLDHWPGAGGVERWAVLPLRIAEDFRADGIAVLAPPKRTGVDDAATPLSGRPPLAPAELSTGDFVVHLDYGIGRLAGLETVGQGDQSADFLVLDYARDDRLLVPAADLDRIWRYGSADAGAKLDSLKTATWAERRAALEQDIRETAKGLVLAARRRMRETAPVIDPAHTPVADRMRRFAARFGYDPTAGQARAVDSVLAAMAAGRPMDHLVCADVGYGKTEVALRAAAAVAFCGFQVAVMAPTSVLARQHLDVFRRRFAGFGIAVEPLTGAMGKAEADRVRAGLADGSVGIVIGTHALLSRSVTFQRLGLMVVDEEQRFGTRQKQDLARRTRGVHVLSLSATPIPRTLQGALAGLRGLSIIDTPPARRRPVRTSVSPLDPAIARAALLRERARGGQSFCIAPRIADLPALEEWVRGLMPDARISTVHGRMGEAALDDALMGFVEGRSEVLVATPIVESGIDIPRANTLLLVRPDLFGLGQLHQLRGRVGRGARQGYACLMVDPDHPLEERAARRLGSLEVIESLGGGFVLSMLDLDQRGGGDLLGEDQTGHLRAVGTELYQRILADALRDLRRLPAEPAGPEVTLGVAQTIPAAYLPEEELRIGLHRRLARTRDVAEVEELRDEIEDRFGPLPDAVAHLLQAAALRCRCRALGITALAAGPAGVSATMADPAAAARVARRAAKMLRHTGEKLSAALEAAGPDGLLANAAAVLDAIGATLRPRRNR